MTTSAARVRAWLAAQNDRFLIEPLPAYAPELNPVEYLWAWLKRHALANFCPANLHELKLAARNKLKSAQHRRSVIVACWKQAELW